MWLQSLLLYLFVIKKLSNGSSFENGTTSTITNGTAVAIINGTTSTITNGTAVAIINGTTSTITNRTAVAIINETTGAIINETTVAIINGTTVAITQQTTTYGSTRNKTNGTITQSKSKRRYYCHVDKYESPTNHTRLKRYVLHGNKWDKLQIRWAIDTHSRKYLTKSIAEDELQKAFKAWESVSKLTFIQRQPEDSNIDIVVKFLTGNHGDRYNFDGEGGTLAHAFYPGSGISGDIHFDDTEQFVSHSEVLVSDNDVVSLFLVAAHELGHSLGLKHSNNDEALMAPFYQVFNTTIKDFIIPTDDQMAIQSLYGSPNRKPSVKPTRRPRPPPHTPIYPNRRPSFQTTRRPRPRPHKTTQIPKYKPPDPKPTYPKYEPPTARPYLPTDYHSSTRSPTDYPRRTRSPTDYPRTAMPSTTTEKPLSETNCTLQKGNAANFCTGSFDAVVSKGSDIIYFKENSALIMNSRSDRFYQYELEFLFPEIEDMNVKQIDAAYSLYAESGLVLFSGKRVFVFDYYHRATEMSLGDIGVNATHIDAAWRWGHNGHVYLLSGHLYWRLGHDNRAQLDYPRDSAVWQQLPEKVSAALTYDGETYFFVNRIFWLFDNSRMKIMDPPLDSASYWLDCPYPGVKLRKLCSSSAVIIYVKDSFLLFLFLTFCYTLFSNIN